MKKNSLYRVLLLIGFFAVPTFAFALGATDVTQGLGSFAKIIDAFTSGIVKSLATLFATAAMTAFFFGIVQYIWGVREGDQNKIKTGNQFMIWGLVALFVMFSVWGIVTFAQKIFGIQNQNTIVIPNIQIQPGTGSSNTNTTTNSPGALQPVGYCPNGTPYYSSDAETRAAVCGSSDGTTANCQAITDAETCVAMQCTWSNAEVSCSR